jgi:TRAP transporter TAXI family solute receptor
MIGLKRIGFAAGAMALGALLGVGAATAQPVAIATLPSGAINNIQAGVIAKVIQENSDLQMRLVSFNSPAAILGATQNKQSEFSYTSNDESGAAIRGQGAYEGSPMTNLQVAATIFPFRVGLIVRNDSDIKKIADLKGKRIPTGWQGFLQGIPLMQAQLANGGLTLDDGQPVPVTDLIRAADDFKAGRTDVFTFAAGGPKVAEINSSIDGGVRFLPFDDSPAALEAMKAIRAEYGVAEVQPAPHLPGIIGPTKLMQYYIVLLAGKDVSEDIVYKAVKTLHANKEQLVAGHPSFGAFAPQGMAVPHPGMEYHPGAVKFYKEAGVWKE